MTRKGPSTISSPGPLRARAEWPRRSGNCQWSEVAAVATDAADRVYLFARDPHRVLVFDHEGALLHTWGGGLFARPHGITIGPDGNVWCADDLDHTVRQYTPEGRHLRTLGTSGKASDTGATSMDFRTVRRGAPPFHYPTNIAFSPEGEIYVSDGYGNARVHKFSPDGRLLFSWGEPGTSAGQFHLPHGIAVGRDGTVYVADRENSRVQLFNSRGEYLAQWTDVARPCQVALDKEGNVYVAELGFIAGMWPDTSAPGPDAPGGRLSVFSPQGKLLSRYGGGRNPTAPGDFFAPHDVCIDSRGTVYVAEVVFSAGAKRGLVSPDCHAIQQFVHARSEGANS